jgi:MoaA/NifB/PqqE/SkfB family radical SAM enzyme
MSNVKRLDLKLGFACNNNCLSCPQAHRRHLGDLSTEEAKNHLRLGIRDGANEVVLTGGEPTVRRDIIEIISHAKSLGYEYIQLQTNGRMLSYVPFARRLVKAGVTEFGPSLHGHTADIHDYITRSPGAFGQVIQGIRNLKELDQQVLMNSVIHNLNYSHLEELVQLFLDMNVDQAQLAFIHPVGNAWEKFDLLVPKKSEAMPFVHRALDLGRQNGLRMMVEAYPFCFMKGYERFCSELYMPPAEIRDAGGHIRNFDRLRRKTGKVKFPQCRNCRFDLICEGPWKEYPQKYGTDEFIPVPGKKLKNPKEILNDES